MKFKLSSIEKDTSIQCRAHIEVGTVDDYAERMSEGDVFPPVILFGTKDRAWIGDGWHRVMAADKLTAKEIDAELRPGTRVDALRFALSANAANGLRRTNADKRRCVEIALKEFDGLSSRAIAELCGVSPDFASRMRPQVSSNDTSHVTGTDGKSYPAKRTPPADDPDNIPGFREGDGEKAEKPAEVDPNKTGETLDAMAVAHKAEFLMSQISFRNKGRVAALKHVIEWCKKEIRRTK